MTIALPARIAADHATNERARRYAENRRYYAGDHRIARKGAGMKPTPRNFSALFVDTTTDHMGQATVSFGTDQPADQFDEYLADSLAAEDVETLDYQSEIACSVDGDAIWKITYDDVERRPRVATVPPESIWVQAAPDNPLAVELVAQRYKISRDDFPVLFPGKLAISAANAWITEAWTPTRWQVYLNDSIELDEPNPYGFVPYVHIPNWRNPGEFWGRGDPERIRDLQDRINFANADADDVMALQGAIVVIEGASADSLTWRPGAMWELPEAAKAYVLDLVGGSGMDQRMAHLEALQHAIHAIGRVPVSALGSTSRNLSGIALQTELGPLIRMVNRKRLTRTAALRRRAQLIAALGTRFDGLPELPRTMRPQVSWTEAIPADRADELANAQAEANLGRDLEAVLRSIGVEDPAAELAARLTQNKQGLPLGVQAPANGGSNGPAGIQRPAAG